MLPLQAIECRNVTYSVHGTTIIKQLSGFFEKEKVTTIIGPSGAGKTTLFRLCNGMRSPSKGDIFIDDRPIESYHPVQLRKKVGIVLQQATMVNGTVKDNLALPLALSGKKLSDEQAIQSLNEVGLTGDMLGREARNLSGGQRQKLSIARTLLNQPDVLLLDEITSSLDLVSKRDIEQLIANVNRKYGTTVIWITHNVEQAKAVADNVWVMMDGELVESGDREHLNAPKNSRVAAFLREDAQ